MIRRPSRFQLFLLASVTAIGLFVATQLLRRVAVVDSVSLLREAQVSLGQKDVEKAGKLLDQILANQPENAPALLERGKLWVMIGEFDNAIEDWGNVGRSRLNQGSDRLASEARYLQGALSIETQKAVSAERYFIEAWDISRENLSAVEHLLRLYVLQMRGDDTRRVLENIQSRRDLALEEMVLHVDAGMPIIDHPEAVRQLEALVRGDPDDFHSRIALARYLLADEQYSQAQSLFAGLSEGMATQSDMIGLNCISLQRQGLVSEAKKNLKRTSQTSAQGYWWWIAAGEIAEFDRQIRLAADCFQQAILVEPESGYAHYRCGMALEAIGEAEDAQRHLKIAADIDRLHQYSSVITRMVSMPPAEFVEGMMRIATVQHDLKLDADAARWARLALQISPNHPQAKSLASGTASIGLANSDPDRSGQQVQGEVLTWLGVAITDHSTPSEKMPISETAVIKFEDRNAAAGLDFQYFNGNSGSKYLIEAMGGGISVLDFDCDGWPDCYFPQGSNIPSDPNDFTHLDQLFRNVDGVKFSNATSGARLAENGYSQGAAAADINNDGFPDVFVANYGRSRLFINLGDGTFEDASDSWGLNQTEMSTSVAMADFDRDGNLDVYLVNYVDRIRVCRDTQGRVSTCNPQNFIGVQDRLFRNSGDGKLVDITDSSGVTVADGKGLGIVATDLDDDGLVDIYVANDTTPNFLFKNLGNMQFQEIGLPSGTALSPDGQAQAGMGIAAADFDGDLLTDMFVTNFYSEPNNLYINRGSMIFNDNAAAARISVPSKPMLGFGTQAEDIDLDGDLDLIVANGHIDDFSYRGEPWKMPTQLFRNLGKGIFESCGDTSGPYFQNKYLGRGIASLDWNRDGKKDFIVMHQDRPPALLENRSLTTNQSITVRLVGTRSNRDAIGARVVLKSSVGTRRRDVQGGDGFYSTNERSLVFASLQAEKSAEVHVFWGLGDPKESISTPSPGVIIVENP